MLGIHIGEIKPNIHGNNLNVDPSPKPRNI